jgi:hypothetical protein
MRRPSKKAIQYLRISIGMTGAMSISDYGCELVLVVQSEMERLGGKFSLRDAAKVADQVEKWNKPKDKP